jgi:hypothetical protein
VIAVITPLLTHTGLYCPPIVPKIVGTPAFIYTGVVFEPYVLTNYLALYVVIF